MHRKKKYLTHLPSVSNMGLHSLHTVRFYELWQNPFVTEVARTLCGEPQLKPHLDEDSLNRVHSNRS